MTTTIDTKTVNARIDLRAYVRRFTELHRESATELSGPCPKCGTGDDRLHVQADWWFCRHCNPIHQKEPGHDAIGFMRWLHNVSFMEAVTMLDSTAIPTRSAPPPAPRQATPQERPTPEALDRMNERMAVYLRDMRADNSPGREYAYSRGFTDETLDTFRIGYAKDTGEKRMARGGPALAIPWYRGAELFSIHFRFLDPNTSPKLKFCDGGRNRGMLWGKYAMSDGGRVLFIVEGELNAMSVHQVASSAGVDVLSLGGESATLTPAAVEFAKTYAKRFVWMDREELAMAKAQQIDGHAVWSGDPKVDANDHLQRLTLRNYLVAMLTKAGADARTLSMLGA